MPGSLVLMIYRNRAGNNVTISPRVAYGNYEPTYYPEPKFEVLSGTGIVNDTMFFSARCTHGCRSWPQGYIDVSDPNQKAIYAVGPRGDFFSDSPDAPVKFHEQFGSFKIDMGRTRGPGDAPIITTGMNNIGTELLDWKKDKSDLKGTMHGVIMVLTFVGVLPFGVLLMRLGNWTRWHALNQGIGLLLVSAGLSLAILSSLLYTRVSSGYGAIL
jgi:hypothetical protein